MTIRSICLIGGICCLGNAILVPFAMDSFWLALPVSVVNGYGAGLLLGTARSL